MPKSSLHSNSSSNKRKFEESSSTNILSLAEQAVQHLAQDNQRVHLHHTQKNANYEQNYRKLNSSYKKDFSDNNSLESMPSSSASRAYLNNATEVTVNDVQLNENIKTEKDTVNQTRLHIKLEANGENQSCIKRKYEISADSEHNLLTSLKQEIIISDSEDEVEVKQECSSDNGNKHHVHVKKEILINKEEKAQLNIKHEKSTIDTITVISDNEDEIQVKQECRSENESEGHVSVKKESLVDEKKEIAINIKHEAPTNNNENEVQVKQESISVNEGKVFVNVKKEVSQCEGEEISTNDEIQGCSYVEYVILSSDSEDDVNTIRGDTAAKLEPVTDANKGDVLRNKYINTNEDNIKMNQNDSKIVEPNLQDCEVNQEGQTARTVFVGNLPASVRKTDLQNFFERYGKIENVVVKRKGSNIRFPKYPVIVHSYIRYKRREDALKALEVNGMEYRKHHLKVEMTRCEKEVQPDKTIFVQHIPFNAESDDLWNIFESCGLIKGITLVRDKYTAEVKGKGFVNFENVESVDLALKMKDVRIGKRKLFIQKYRKEKKFNKPTIVQVHSKPETTQTRKTPQNNLMYFTIKESKNQKKKKKNHFHHNFKSKSHKNS